MALRSNIPLWHEVSSRLDEQFVGITQLTYSSFGPTFKLVCAANQYFVKLSPERDVLAAEHDGLSSLGAKDAIRVPKPVALETFDSNSVLVSEYINLTGQKTDFPRLAAALFALHSQTCSNYGWHRDNYIGQSRQINTRCDNWAEFFLNHRLSYQLDLALKNGYFEENHSFVKRLPKAVKDILFDHHPQASLLHGDLWGGNFGFDEFATPVIFDPAVYCGDLETDLAMTQLFGALPKVFYSSYQKLNPLPQGWELRISVYNLYHALNHLNIFGASYLSLVENLAHNILREGS